MGVVKAFTGAISGVLADQWIDIITAGSFDEYTVVSPGLLVKRNNGRGSNDQSSEGIISNGSKLYVPENTAAFIFSQSGIEEIITAPGGYEYYFGQESIFSWGDIGDTLIKETAERIRYGGIPSDEKKVAFINLREIRNIKFGTKGPQLFHDPYYDVDLEIRAHGAFSVSVVNPTTFVRNYLPPNVNRYSFHDSGAREQIITEFLQSFIVGLNSFSKSYRVSELPAQAEALSNYLVNESPVSQNWEERFGLKIGRVAIENIEFSDESRKIINRFSSDKLSVDAYETVSQRAADIAAQQKIAEGVLSHGLGEGGGVVLGMNIANAMNLDENTPRMPQAAQKGNWSVDEQVELLKKIKELLDAGILTQEEFEKKKKDILGL